MISLRDIVIFFAGAAFFHTINHLFIHYFVALPLSTKVVELTPSLNNWAIAISGVITIILIIWAARLSSHKRSIHKF